MIEPASHHPTLSATYRSDQRDILVGLIGRVVDRCRPRALLDIGAGSGGVASAIAAMVPRYVAIEQDAGRATGLRDLGLTVVEACFPCPVTDGPFDMIVASHAIPEGPIGDYAPFVEAAWSLLAPGGTLLISTFKGPAIDPICQLVEDCGRGPIGPDPRYPELVRLLSARGTVTFDTLSSHVRTATIDDIAIRFASWLRLAGGLVEDRLTPAMAAMIEARFRRDDAYVVAIPHDIVTAVKPER
jgi:hypothetical protein